MRKNNNTDDKSFSEFLIEGSTKIIKQKYSDWSRTINGGMVPLFWEIGSKINDHFNTNYVSQNDDLLIIYLSETLSHKFGSFFNKNNLSIMRQFADKCSHKTLKHVAEFVNWKYIPYLLTLSSQDQWIYYIRLINLERLTTNELKGGISKKLFEQNGLNLKDPNQAFNDVIFSNNNGINLPVENYFCGSNAEAFRLLFEPSQNSSIKVQTSFETSPIENDLIMLLTSKVYKYQNNYNNWLNSVFNLSFRTLGWVILQLFKKFNNKVNDEEISNLSQNLSGQYGQLFNKEQLYRSIEFAKQFDDLFLATEFAEKVTWEHIKILLPIVEMEAKLFYARRVSENNLSAQSLKQLIKSNIYESQGHSQDPLQEIKAIADTLETTVLKNKNTTLKITKKAIEAGVLTKPHLKFNVFKNPDLMKFLTAC